ncbi:MAG: ABC transporter permease [Ureaplasma sp.]|nr:ABC transporter permease [Ureaplasma sp.]
MKKVYTESNATGFSVENRELENFATYNIVKDSEKLITSIEDLTLEQASDNLVKIYNPLLMSTDLMVNGKQYEAYGFFKTYLNNSYTTGKLSQEWKNIIFNKDDDSLPIVVQNTPDKYKNQLSDVFSLYTNILPPSPSEVESSKYEILFNENIYSFNPWSLFIDENNNIKTNSFGIIKPENFDSEINTNISFNHGIFDSLYSFIVGTNISFLGENEMSKYKAEMQQINSDVIMSKNYENVFSNNWKQLSSTIPFLDSNQFNDFIRNYFWDSANTLINNYYSPEYYRFLNLLVDNIKNNFMQDTKTFKLNYEINSENSTGLSQFFGDIYLNPENKYYLEKDNIFSENDKKYFSGTFDIPIIPFITVLPSNDNLSLLEIKKWASDYRNYTDPNKSIVNTNRINLIVNNFFNSVSNKANEFFENLLVSNSVSSEIRKEFYKNYNLDYFLSNEMKMNFTKSSNFTLTDANSNSFIMSKSKYYSDENKVNNLVIYDGRELFKSKIDEDYIDVTITSRMWEWNVILTETNVPPGYQTVEEYQKDYFLSNNLFFNLMNLFSQLKLNTNQEISDEYYSLINQVVDLNLFNNNFGKWKNITYNFLTTYTAVLIAWNGAGYDVEFNRRSAADIYIGFNAKYYEPTSYMSVLGLNYSQLKNKSKEIIDSTFAESAIKLPYKINKISNEELLDNPIKYKDHFIYNPYTKKIEFYNDFLDWLSKIESRFKINISGDEFVIIGKGISAEFAYPITSNNQLLINNNSPVVFTNELGYDKVFENQDAIENSNYFVNFNHSVNQIANNYDLGLINQWTQRVNNANLAYRLSDSKQPNQLLYLRMNFPSSILEIVLIITIFIGAIIVLLSIVFMFILMRSIIKQNLNTFAVGMANGISKRKLLFSFMPFVLIPSGIASIIGYSLSFFIYPFISNSIQDYWILEYIRFSFSFWYLLFTFVVMTLVIFIVQVIVVFTVLNKNVSTLLVSKLEFKYNRLIQTAHKSFSKLKPLASFRMTYMLGNLSRFILLLLMMTSFVSLTAISATTIDTFNTAVQKTVQNKKYNYAIDLYSPTEQGGMYYNIPYNLVGSRQQGLTPLYNLNSSDGFYNSEYKDDLTYNIPDTDKSIVYDNLFLPSASLISDIQGNLLFFRNRVVNMATMDFGINFMGNYINPWEWAKKIIPNSIINSITEKFQTQLNYAFAYVYSIQNDLNNPDRNMWLSNKSEGFSLKEDLNNSKNPDDWNQDNWIYKYVKEDNHYRWKSNDQLLSTGLPNFTMTQSTVYFITRLISLIQNSEYINIVQKEFNIDNVDQIDQNFMLGLNVVPVIPELDETYTYIRGFTKFKNKDGENNSIKIYGIKPYSDQVVLWDEYNGLDLKKYLQEYQEESTSTDEIIYPLIINEVVSKKYKLYVNDIIELQPENTYSRFIDKFNQVQNKSYKFKIMGVTTSKSEEQYYTTQEIANKILGFKKPELANEYDLTGKNYDYKWINQEEIDNYIPFNGVFSKQDFPKLLSNFATLYSPSGLSPISGTLPSSDRGDNYGQLYKNFSEINKILKCSIVDENSGKNGPTILKFCDDYKNLFGTDKYFSSALSSIDVTLASSLIGSVMDSTLSNINTICMLSLLPSVLIIIILMSYMIVVESKRLVALLKVLGFSNWSNTITLSTIQFVVIGLAIILGYCFSLAVISALKVFAFSSFNIIINPIIPLWTIPITIGVLLLIVSIITATIYWNLRKSNPAMEIAIR